jgi:hypothetical protein
MCAIKEKRGKDRLVIRNKLAILDAAALAKVRYGRYAQFAHQWKLTQQQLNDLVRRNRTYFASIVKALRKNPTIKRTTE